MPGAPAIRVKTLWMNELPANLRLALFLAQELRKVKSD
jgi:hypothetical protein